jgi:hypothetical protein
VASGKVARRAAVTEIRELLDSDEIAALIEEIDALRWTGRRGYGARSLVGACLVKSLHGLPTWTRAASLIADHPGLQDAIGGCPSVWACYRFTVKLREHSGPLADCLDRIAAALRAELPDIGIDVAIDASDMPGFANGQPRERYSDPDASWGHRSAVSTRGAGSFYGYKLHLAACTRTGLPLAWQVETARRHESNYAIPLLDALHARGYQPASCAMDKGYDNDRILRETIARDCIPVVPLKRRRTSTVLPLVRNSQEFRDLYSRRVAVEREFGRLKMDYALAPLRVRGLARVQLHADLTMLARLALALRRTQAVALAA